ncbi:MAG: hypothetical protein GTO45_24270 [Candidatus Aminicenantes bacterium]|nr:hypothetical protein [Candidatus Aminicenantes bacterium]NIM81869.1 hypothetical protein [Candidatus Aminicenantes bacterium]NIN21246.1 hypothetical protein [Candidatus Aminicenantes bacterium]NIN45067.1 hypothetical protein [Candidatus Aminicenantes bacterium]NIN87884.1 hypothetical protein [Candidatus Aminicenantes bacterium]
MAEISVQSSKTQKGGTDKKNPVSSKSRADLSQSLDSPVKQILYLQKTIGNWAVTRLFQTGAIQARFKIGKPNDVHEKEADKMANEVVTMSEPVSAPPEKRVEKKGNEAPQTMPLLQREGEEEEKGAGTKPLIQREDIGDWPKGTYRDPIPIKWFKKEDDYPTVDDKKPREGVKLPAIGGRKDRNLRVTDTNFNMEGRVVKTRDGRPSENKKIQILRHLRALGTSMPIKQGGTILTEPGNTAGTYQIDHVRDLNWMGRDTYSNLWPAESSVNQAFNATNDQYARARDGDEIKVHAVSYWARSTSKRYFWISKVVSAPSSRGAHVHHKENPVNSGGEVPKKKT